MNKTESQGKQTLKIDWTQVNIQGMAFEKVGLTFQMPLTQPANVADVQLDTGCFHSIAHVPKDFPGQQVELQIAHERKVIAVIKDREKEPIHILLGVDLLQDIQVQIDFERDLISFSRDLDKSGFAFIDGRKDRYGRLHFPLAFADQPSVDVMLDTGASLFDVSSTKTLAMEVIRQSKTEPRSLVLPPYSHPDGNKELVFTIYKISEPVKLGPIIRKNFEISVHDSKNPHLDFFQYDPPVFGLIGLSYFKSSKSLLLDWQKNQLGVK